MVVVCSPYLPLRDYNLIVLKINKILKIQQELHQVFFGVKV